MYSILFLSGSDLLFSFTEHRTFLSLLFFPLMVPISFYGSRWKTFFLYPFCTCIFVFSYPAICFNSYVVYFHFISVLLKSYSSFKSSFMEPTRFITSDFSSVFDFSSRFPLSPYPVTNVCDRWNIGYFSSFVTVTQVFGYSSNLLSMKGGLIYKNFSSPYKIISFGIYCLITKGDSSIRFRICFPFSYCPSPACQNHSFQRFRYYLRSWWSVPPLLRISIISP